MHSGTEGGFEITYDAARDVLRLEYIGRMSSSLILAAADALFTTPGIGERTCILAVYLHADIDEIDMDALIAFQRHKDAMGYPNLTAAAVVTDRPSHIAMAELWAALKPGGKAGARIFTSETAALDWLSTQRKNFR